MGRRTPKKEEVIDNLEKFYKSRKEVFNFFKDYSKLFERLAIALAQVNAGNNSENL